MIEKLFDQNGWLFRFLCRTLDLICLNFLFILTCIPVVTVGASVCAMYSVLLKAVRNEESYIFRSYLRAFRRNLGRGILTGVLCFGIAGTLLIHIFYVAGKMGRCGSVWVFICGVCLVFFCLPAHYLFPLQARYEGTLTELFGRSFFISIKYLFATVQLISIRVFPVALTVFVALSAVEKLVWICTAMTLIGFSGIMFLSSFVYRRVFDDIEHGMEERDKKSY